MNLKFRMTACRISLHVGINSDSPILLAIDTSFCVFRANFRSGHYNVVESDDSARSCYYRRIDLHVIRCQPMKKLNLHFLYALTCIIGAHHLKNVLTNLADGLTAQVDGRTNWQKDGLLYRTTLKQASQQNY